MATQKAVKKLSKGKKAGIITGIVLAVIVVAVIVYGFFITRTGYWLLAQFRPDTPEQIMSYESATDTVRTIGDEGFVLMKNEDDLLPLNTSAENKKKISLFGIRSISLVYNAGGSSASNVENCVKLEDALTGEYGNFELNQDLLHFSYNYYKNGRASIAPIDAPANKSASEFIEDATNTILPEIPLSAYTDTTLYDDGRTIVEHARDYSDVAMMVIGRGGGEYFDFEPYQLRLLEDERSTLDTICEQFDNVILVINSANALELDFLDEYPSIKSVIWIGYPGQSGVESLARILNGTVNPSGHLADTWLKDNLASPAVNNYLPLRDNDTFDKQDAFHYTNAPTDLPYSVQGDEIGYFTQLSEGIYVGYKYFETRFDTDSSYDYESEVAYPFGHGLSYTTFEKEILSMEENDGKISVRVSIRNTGAVAGKDVLQIYYNPPYTGAIEKSTVNLVAFKKTNEIQPGETEYYTIDFAVEDMASYDYKNHEAYVLEAGDYVISLRDDAHNINAEVVYALDRDVVYREDADGKRASDIVEATNQFDSAFGVDDYLTREWNQESRAFTGPKAEDYIATQETLDAISVYVPPTDMELGLTEADLPTYGVTLETTMMLSELKNVAKDDPKWDTFLSQLTLEEMMNLCGNGAWQINGIDRLGVPQTLTPDGSTTVTASMYAGAIMGEAGCGVTYPTPVVLASSWNHDIFYLMGTSAATEAISYGYAGWYAPAMNIHKTPFNGRNFEYYSEDSMLSGAAASNVIRSATDNGIICYMKHFALNDRETACRAILFTWANEQTIREIYLKPFEEAVKAGGSLAAMSSFNFIGTEWAGGNSALLQRVLRDEWGFEGLVLTDANMYGFMSPIQMIYNGGNMSLDVMGAWAGGIGHGTEIMKYAQDGEATRIGTITNVYNSSKDILFAVSRTWAVE